MYNKLLFIYNKVTIIFKQINVYLSIFHFSCFKYVKNTYTVTSLIFFSKNYVLIVLPQIFKIYVLISVISLSIVFANTTPTKQLS